MVKSTKNCVFLTVGLTLPRKTPYDLVRLEPMTPVLRVKHLTTEPRGTRKTLRSPCLRLMKSRKDMNNVSCRCDMTEILLTAV